MDTAQEALNGLKGEKGTLDADVVTKRKTMDEAVAAVLAKDEAFKAVLDKGDKALKAITDAEVTSLLAA